MNPARLLFIHLLRSASPSPRPSSGCPLRERSAPSSTSTTATPPSWYASQVTVAQGRLDISPLFTLCCHGTPTVARTVGRYPSGNESQRKNCEARGHATRSLITSERYPLHHSFADDPGLHADPPAFLHRSPPPRRLLSTQDRSRIDFFLIEVVNE